LLLIIILSLIPIVALILLRILGWIVRIHLGSSSIGMYCPLDQTIR
jgi:hypothetical protein